MTGKQLKMLSQETVHQIRINLAASEKVLNGHQMLNYFGILLAHLSRRLIGELIVYEGIRRPSVCQQCQTTSPLKP